MSWLFSYSNSSLIQMNFYLQILSASYMPRAKICPWTHEDVSPWLQWKLFILQKATCGSVHMEKGSLSLAHQEKLFHSNILSWNFSRTFHFTSLVQTPHYILCNSTGIFFARGKQICNFYLQIKSIYTHTIKHSETQCHSCFYC